MATINTEPKTIEQLHDEGASFVADLSTPYVLSDRTPEPTTFEKDAPGARAVTLPALDVDETAIPADLTGDTPDLPEMGQLAVVRHYTRISKKNFSIDTEFYPLGSCTMKYNPRINEYAAAQPGFASLHPMQEDDDIQGRSEEHTSELQSLTNLVCRLLLEKKNKQKKKKKNTKKNKKKQNST